jgi:hypothetical protein
LHFVSALHLAHMNYLQRYSREGNSLEATDVRLLAPVFLRAVRYGEVLC